MKTVGLAKTAARVRIVSPGQIVPSAKIASGVSPVPALVGNASATSRPVPRVNPGRSM